LFREESLQVTWAALPSHLCSGYGSNFPQSYGSRHTKPFFFGDGFGGDRHQHESGWLIG